MSDESSPHSPPEITEDLVEEVLEQDKPLSECLLWKLQEDYYTQAGADTWDSVPFFMTSNAFIGRAYAEMIIAFLVDYQDHLRLDEPVYLIELAAGSGALGFYVVKELSERLSYFEKLKDLSWVYVLTDFSENSITSWENHTKLQPYLEQGLIETAIFRPEEENSLTLRQSGKVLSSKTLNNPVISLANYFFDSIRQDLFRVDNGVLKEDLVSFSRQRPASEVNKPIKLEDLRTTEKFVEIAEDYYPDPRLNRVLQRYRERFQKASVLFPIGAFRAISNLLELSGNKLVLISSDKGYVNAEQLRGHGGHNFAKHGDGFSFMVNYHAIQWFFEEIQGTFFSTKDENLSLWTVMGILIDRQDCALNHSRYYFEETLTRQNPINNLCQSQHLLIGIKQLSPEPLFKSGLSFLQLCNYDPFIFYSLGEPFFDLALELNEKQKDMLVDALDRVYENYYFVRKKFNSLYWIGAIYFLLERYSSSIEVFHESMRVMDPDAISLYYIGSSHEMLGYPAEALSFYQEAFKLDPTCEMYQSGIQRLTTQA